MSVEDRSATRRKQGHLTLHDQELLAARNAEDQVCIVLAQATYFTDDVGKLVCLVEKVDKYAVKIRVIVKGEGASVWVTKQAILSTEVLR